MTDEAKPAPNKSQPDKKPAQPKKQQNECGGLWFLAILTFILAIGGLAAGYYAWTLLQKELTANAQKSQQLQEHIDQLSENEVIRSLQRNVDKKFSQLTGKFSNTEKSLQEMSADQEAMWESVKKVAQYTTDNRLSWMLKEVEYVLRIAQHSLSLNKDTFTARKALQAADARLAELADPRILPVRQSISAQLRKLDQLDQVDYAGLELKIDNTISTLHKNIVKDQQLFADRREQAENESNDKTSTKQNADPDLIEQALEATKHALSKKVVVTRGEQEVALFIEQQEKKRAYEFLHAKLLGAKYAVATHDDENYHQQLKAALAWIKEYQTLYNRHQLQSTLQALNTVDLQPELPDISEPYVKLQGLMHTLKVADE